MTEGDTSLRQLASTLVAEAEQQQLLRQLQKAQKLNGELTTDLEGARRRLSRLRYERKVYEREVAGLEFTSGSSDEEEAPLVGKKTAGWGGVKRDGSDELVDVEGGKMMGTKKKKRVVKSAEAAAMTPRKVIQVPMDEAGNVLLPVTVGVVTLHATGQIIHDRPAFHNKRYIWPVGYHSSRPYLSAIDADAQTVYHSQILDSGTGPLFDVYADDNPDQHYHSPTPTGAWTAILKQVNAVRGREYTNSASGPDFFGLANPTISMIIEKLPEAAKCTQYQRKMYAVEGGGVIGAPVIGDGATESAADGDDTVDDDSTIVFDE